MSTDRRHRTRVRTDMEVWFRPSGQLFSRGRVFDLSDTGAAVYTDAHTPHGSVMDLTLRLGEGRYVGVKAHQVWQRDGLVGLRFEDRAPQAVQNWLSSKGPTCARSENNSAAFSRGLRARG